MPDDSSNTAQLLLQVRKGDSSCRGVLLSWHEHRLTRMIEFRLDTRLRGRVDVSDVVQEVFIEAIRHLDEFLDSANMPFYLWLRGIAHNKLLELHRQHLGTKMRDARREQADGSDRAGPEDVAQLLDSITSPSLAAMRAEWSERLKDALKELDPGDLEVIALRHFEHLTPTETAQVLGLHPKAAGMRYIRALEKLRRHLGPAADGPTNLWY